MLISKYYLVHIRTKFNTFKKLFLRIVYVWVNTYEKLNMAKVKQNNGDYIGIKCFKWSNEQNYTDDKKIQGKTLNL